MPRRSFGLRTQVQTARWITHRGAHYVLAVKGNQRGARKTLKALPWKDVPSVSWGDVSHGQRVRRTLKAAWAPGWVDFPAAVQVAQVRCTGIIGNRENSSGKDRSVEVVRLLFHGPRASITTTRSLIRHPQRVIRPLTRPTTRTDFAAPLHHLRTRDGLHEAGLISSNAMVR